jgi:serine/threonine protein kinase
MSCPSCDHAPPPGTEGCPRCGLDLSNGIRRRSLVAGRYEVTGLLGLGTIAAVYRALDRYQDRSVAVKVFRPDVRRSTQTDAAFRADLTLAQRIRHRNFCVILECGEHNGLLYVVMEIVEGQSLKQRMKSRSGLPPDEAFDVAIQVAGGLQALHDAGLTHQDIKPQNVILDGQGVARLMDLDVAKQWGWTGAITITAVGQLFGAPEYVSPEHARGVRCDHRSDIYSLGCMLYETFTGHPPFRAATPVGTALKHVHEPIPLEGPKAARIPEPMLPVLRKALAKNPARRHASARALASAVGLARTMSGLPGRLAPTPEPPSPLPVLLGALNPLDMTIRMPALDLSRRDPSANRGIPALLQALETAREQARARADAEPLAELLRGVDVPDPVVVREEKPAPPSGDVPADEAAPVRFVGSASSVAILVEALREHDGAVRAKAARALGGIGPAAKEAIPVLLGALRDREAHVRWDAARALGQIGAAAAEGLAAAVNDKDPVVRQIVADALKQIIQRKRQIAAD